MNKLNTIELFAGCGGFVDGFEKTQKYNFKGKNVIITGGSMGLGKATATEFARAGATIILADINKEEMDNTSRELQREFNVKVLEYIVDVSNYNEVESMVSSVYKKLGRVDILINNAGIFAGRTVGSSYPNILSTSRISAA